MLAFRIALKELRGAFGDFRLFLGCLIVGVTVIAAVGLLGARVQLGLRQEARALLGGDAEISIGNGRATAEQLDFLSSFGTLSTTLNTRAMATVGNDSTLVELKGVDDAYPLVGAVGLASGTPLAKALESGGIVIGEDLRDRFHVKPGDHIMLGDVSFVIADILKKEPDHLAGAFSLGSRVLVSIPSLQNAQLLEPGGLIRYNYRLLLHKASALKTFKKVASSRFPHAPWIIKTFNENNRTVQGLVERLQLFLTLAGLSALLIGGVGIRGAAEAYISSKGATIATFKSLGAKRGMVLRIYCIVLGCITLLGIIISMIAGAFLSAFMLPYLARFFPISLESSEDAEPLLLAAAFGGLTVFTFSLGALARGVEIKPTVLFRGVQTAQGVKLNSGIYTVNILLTTALIALVIATSGDTVIAACFIAAAIGCFAVFFAAARLLAWIAQRISLPSGTWRLAVANLHRPHSPVFSIMLSIGIGLSVLTALLLVEGNIERNIKDFIPAQAPSLFLIDIQPTQKDALMTFLESKPYVSSIVSQPMVRGRISQLNGVPVEQALVNDDVKWATESDRGLSYASSPPNGAQIVQGSWWPADYHGAPLASLDRKLAQGMHLKLGDSITLNILGQDVTAKIVNLREVNYMSLRMNFALILSHGALDNFPSTSIATLRVEGADNEAALVHALAGTFPNVSAIRIRDTLIELEEIVGHISDAVRVTALFTLAAGIMVLLSTLAAALDKRALDTVIFKVLGATTYNIFAIFLSEWLIIALVTGIISCVFGAIGARLILLRFEGMEFHLLPGILAKVIVATLFFIACTGLVLLNRTFKLKANVILRND